MQTQKEKQNQPSPQTRLKNIIEKDNTQEGVKQFKKILDSCSGRNAYDNDILLRWVIKNQKKYFNQYFHILQQYNVNVNFADSKEIQSNLMLACSEKSEEIVQALIDHPDCKCDLYDYRNSNALIYSIKNRIKGQKYIRLLLKKFPQLKIPQNNRINPLAQALQTHKPQLILRALIEEGISPNISIDENKNTVLHQLVQKCQKQKGKNNSSSKQIIRFLIQAGADPYLRNKRGQDVFDVADKFVDEFKAMYEQIRKGGKDGNTNTNGDPIKQLQKQAPKDAKPNPIPTLTLNTASQRQEIYNEAQKIYKKYKYLLQTKEQQQKQQQEQQQELQKRSQNGYDDDPFEPAHNFIDKLTNQIQQFTQVCQRDHACARKQLDQFLMLLRPITNQFGFQVEIYGSYATGLWINHCDIDILLIPRQHFIRYTHQQQCLQQIFQRLKSIIGQRSQILRNSKTPLMRIYLGDSMRSRKLDISILSQHNTGRQHVQYINQLIKLYPKIKPLFLIIKKLSYCYRLNDPLKCGVRSFAIFLMLVIFMQEQHQELLGELLIRFLYKYGYVYDYDYVDQDHGRTMVLNLPDPVNLKNNIGKFTDAFGLQRMFKTAYFILHTRDASSRLDYMFESKDMFA